jgi:hypothetical protein
MSAHSAVRINNDLAASQAGVALRAADDEIAGRVYQKLCFAVEHVPWQNFLDYFLDYEAADFGVFHVAAVLC